MTPARHLLLLCLVPLSAACATDEGEQLDCDSPQMFYPDGDGDGFGDDAAAALHCTAPAGFVARGGDCQDGNPAINPDKNEICDTIDNDCDGTIDDADTSLDVATTNTFYRDSDNDGFGDAASNKRACAKPVGYAMSSSDCNDTSAAINPSAPEICDHVDNDCDSKIDALDSNITGLTAFYRDLDHDNFGAGTATMACDAPVGYVVASNDCNDSDNASYPGGTEICDGADNDCDGGTDGTPALPNRCTALVGTYAGTYSHLTQEKLGTTVINSMSCTGTGSGSLALNRKPGIQGTFTCNYTGSLGGFSSSQSVKLSANVKLDGTVTGTIDHFYDGTSQHRVYNVTGTQTATTMNLTGTGSWYPNAMSAVPWVVSFSFTTNR